MAGIYIHIPFCKKKCSYCDFYKTTSVQYITDFLKALETEIKIRNNYLGNEKIRTIYLGGGTPSLLSPDELNFLYALISDAFNLDDPFEFTMEANPDDISLEYLCRLKSETPVNRLSIGIQSFYDAHLKLLNRRHTSQQSRQCIEMARKAGFMNLSIDLIYGIPGMQLKELERNLEIASPVDHLSAYHLTIEKGTSLWTMINKGLLNEIDEAVSLQQYALLNSYSSKKGFIHYEISNFCKPGFYSQHNSNYWKKEKYLGLGPSAHSYDIASRQWNVASLRRYLNALKNNELFFEREELSLADQFNEYVMVSLRTCWGINMKTLIRDFGEDIFSLFTKKVERFIHQGIILEDKGHFIMNESGWFISDAILPELILNRTDFKKKADV